MDKQLENTFFFVDHFNCVFDSLNNYKATQAAYFILGELYFFPKKWFISSALLSLFVEGSSAAVLH